MLLLLTFLGVQDEDGTNLIPIPSWWGKVVYAAGTKIIYRNNVHFPDRLEIEGPTDKVLRIVVSGLDVTVSYCPHQ